MADSKISALGDGGSLASGDQLVIARSGADNSILAQHLPGWEIGYDQITSPVTIASSTESSGTTVITCAAHTFDGSPVLATFFCPYLQPASSIAATATICLFESSTQIGRMCVVQNSAAQLDAVPMLGSLRFTPTASSHTYTVTVFGSSAAGSVGAGAGGTGAYIPAFIRFTKV